MTEVTRAEAMGGLWRDALRLAEGLHDEDWERPVPWTPAWRVADLVSHLGGVQSAFNGDPQPEPPADWSPPQNGSPFDHAMAGPIEARRGWDPAQRLDELRRAAAGHVAHLESVTDWLEVAEGPVGPTTQDGLFRIRAFDLWVHLQDLREALGSPPKIDDPSEGAVAAHNYVLGLFPWMFVKRVGAPEGATLRVTAWAPVSHDSVLKVTDGRATWDPTADPGDCVITGSPGALTLLVTGRGAPQRWRDAGALQWEGARAEEFMERARVF